MPFRDRCRRPSQDILDQIVDGIGEPGGGTSHLDDAGQVVPGDSRQSGPQAKWNRIIGGRPDEQAGPAGDRLTEGAEAPAMAQALSRAGLVRTRSGSASIIEINLGQAPAGSAPFATSSTIDDLRSGSGTWISSLPASAGGIATDGPSVGHERQRMPGRIVGVCHFGSPELN